MLSFIILFTVGIISICVLFTSLIVYANAFPIINAIYIGTVMSIVLYIQNQVHKDVTKADPKAIQDSTKVHLVRLRYIALFNIILSVFIFAVLIFKLFKKQPTNIVF
jgi:hypothetical protein